MIVLLSLFLSFSFEKPHCMFLKVNSTLLKLITVTYFDSFDCHSFQSRQYWTNHSNYWALGTGLHRYNEVWRGKNHNGLHLYSTLWWDLKLQWRGETHLNHHSDDDEVARFRISAMGCLMSTVGLVLGLTSLLKALSPSLCWGIGIFYQDQEGKLSPFSSPTALRAATVSHASTSQAHPC